MTGTSPTSEGTSAMSAMALNYELAGPTGIDDAAVLLLGGSLGATLRMWDPQAAGLSDRVRVVPFDHRGHGGSPVPPGPYTIAEMGEDVVALLDTLGVQRASYAGLSIGGMVGQWLAVNHPERVENLILIATSAYAPPADDWRDRATLVRESGSAEVVADTIVARWFTPDWAAAHPEVVRAHREMIASSPVEGYAGCCEAIAALDLRAQLSRITAPTLVISGAQDPSLPPEHQRLIAEAIPGARLEVVEHAYHLPNVEHPEAVNDLIASALGVLG